MIKIRNLPIYLSKFTVRKVCVHVISKFDLILCLTLETNFSNLKLLFRLTPVQDKAKVSLLEIIAPLYFCWGVSILSAADKIPSFP